MEFLCKKCDRSIIENETESYDYLANLPKKNNKCFYKTYTIDNIKWDEVDKILNDYIPTHNKKFGFYSINCEFVIEFYNNFIANTETNYFFYNTDIVKYK